MDEVVGGLLLGCDSNVVVVGGLLLVCKDWGSELVQVADWGEGYALLLRLVMVEWVRKWRCEIGLSCSLGGDVSRWKCRIGCGSVVVVVVACPGPVNKPFYWFFFFGWAKSLFAFVGEG